MTDYRSIFQDRARFLPAVQNSYHRLVGRSLADLGRQRMPPGLRSTADLDYLDPGNPFFTLDAGLISAGQFPSGVLRSGMMQKRPGTMIMGDSGGYQVATGVVPWAGDETRATILDFAETFTDVCPILDVPTSAVDPGDPVFNSFEACLRETHLSAVYFERHRQGRARLLSVLQGRSRHEADQWDELMATCPLDGWGLGGDLRFDMFETARRVVNLVRRGLLGPTRNHLHFFGTARLDIAVLLSALQLALREHLKCPEFTITFDSSTASRLIISAMGMAPANLSRRSFTYNTVQLPRHSRNVGWCSPFPLRQSGIGAALRVEDLCVLSVAGKATAWDALAEGMIVNHNIETIMQALDAANARLELRQVDAERLAPIWLVQAYQALRDMFRYEDPMWRLGLVETQLRSTGKNSHPTEEDRR